MNRLACFVAIVVAIAGLAPTALAQKAVTISGTIQDSSGEVIPGVGIELRKISCKCAECPKDKGCDCCPDQRQTTSDSEGRFAFSVSPGVYRVTASMSGFAVATQEVDVNSGQSKNVTIRIR